MAEQRLCYVRGQWAYFTTQPIADQWGDDWNDAPYEHNAGPPYGWGKHNEERGVPKWTITEYPFSGPLETPADAAGLNSGYSVEQINAGAVPWLQHDRWHTGERVRIFGGATFDEFCALIKQSGGMVYGPLWSAPHE